MGVPEEAGSAGELPGGELLAAAQEIIGAAAAAGVTMRLLGGVAVFHLAPSAGSGALARSYHDFDVAVPARQGGPAARLFRAAGYSEDQHFNALHGAQRLIFQSPAGFVVDVLVGEFQMCHRLNLDLPSRGYTIHPADLLLTKLQIVQITQKDLLDAIALLFDIPVLDLPVDEAGVAIETSRFVAPLGNDWGFQHTVELNLPRVVDRARDQLGARDARTVAAAAGRLSEAMAAAPKTLRWKTRARVGERVPWYDLPEEV